MLTTVAPPPVLRFMREIRPGYLMVAAVVPDQAWESDVPPRPGYEWARRVFDTRIEVIDAAAGEVSVPFRRVALVLAISCLTACGTDDAASDTELYTRVLTASQVELGLPDRLAIHPLVALWPDDGPIDLPLTRFNAYDTTSVPEIIAAQPTDFRLCTLATTGMCQVSPGEVAVVLSPLRELDRDSRAVRLVVYDGRSGSGAYRDYLARLKRGWTGTWLVASLTRLN